MVLVRLAVLSNRIQNSEEFWPEFKTSPTHMQSPCLWFHEPYCWARTHSSINLIHSFIYWKWGCSRQSNLCKNWWKSMFASDRFLQSFGKLPQTLLAAIRNATRIFGSSTFLQGLSTPRTPPQDSCHFDSLRGHGIFLVDDYEPWKRKWHICLCYTNKSF